MTKTTLKPYGATVDIAIRMYVEYQAENDDPEIAHDQAFALWRDQLDSISDVDIDVIEVDRLS